ncbi:cation:proton antiporter regulatory subunit [Paenibacillus bovis]|uniref:Potassium:proton antiporter n=1 Tax=Paenibacillus bovis TaxID=1616788 RepID=A0A172ZKU6_9BACL|nr:cation:proton antiporter regulatory subunit [Paenibacillus bovis]ANF98032.1 potassium:proton antiporter [Paenibacillus bovis]
MAIIRETDLPGIGRKFMVETDDREKVAIVVHEDGKREVYHSSPAAPDDHELVMTLNDREARQVASIIGGMSYQPTALEQVEFSISKLSIEWYKLRKGMHCIGKSIGELAIRENTGTVIIASLESAQQKISPGPEYVLQDGYTLVIAGERNDIHSLKMLLERGGS